MCYKPNMGYNYNKGSFPKTMRLSDLWELMALRTIRTLLSCWFNTHSCSNLEFHRLFDDGTLIGSGASHLMNDLSPGSILWASSTVHLQYCIENMAEYSGFCDYIQYVTVCSSAWMLGRVADATIVGVWWLNLLPWRVPATFSQFKSVCEATKPGHGWECPSYRLSS
jgi:hypothetical protein